MKNANYNLIKMLLSKLDDAWRVEKHYAMDAKKSGCKSCQAVLKRMLADDEKHADSLRSELERHIKGGKFD